MPIHRQAQSKGSGFIVVKFGIQFHSQRRLNWTNSQWADRKFPLQICRHFVLNFAAVAAILHEKF